MGHAPHGPQAADAAEAGAAVVALGPLLHLRHPMGDPQIVGALRRLWDTRLKYEELHH